MKSYKPITKQKITSLEKLKKEQKKSKRQFTKENYTGKIGF